MKTIAMQEAAARLRAAEDVLILTHIRPDGDAAGSACALCLGLRAMGKTAYLAPNPVSMRRYERYMTPYFAPAGFVPRFVAAVDTPGEGQLPPGFSGRVDLAVDHHGTNSGYAAETYLEADSAAAGELVWLLLRELGLSVTAPMGEALYTALATDTNGFRTTGTTTRTLYIASQLYGTGFDAYELSRRLFEVKSRARLRLEAALYDSMRFPRDGVCVMTLPFAVIRDCGATEDDMDKISTLAMTPEGTRAGLLLRELPDGTWKLSLRTDGRPHAGQVLHALGGGGHADAAGAVLPGTSAALERAVLDALSISSDGSF